MFANFYAPSRLYSSHQVCLGFRLSMGLAQPTEFLGLKSNTILTYKACFLMLGECSYHLITTHLEPTHNEDRCDQHPGLWGVYQSMWACLLTSMPLQGYIHHIGSVWALDWVWTWPSQLNSWVWNLTLFGVIKLVSWCLVNVLTILALFNINRLRVYTDFSWWFRMAEAKERNLSPAVPSDMQTILKRCDNLEKEVRSLKLNLSFMNR